MFLFSFTYVGADDFSHIASRSVLSMASSNAACSQSNIYFVDPDYYHKQQNIQSPRSICEDPSSSPSILAMCDKYAAIKRFRNEYGSRSTLTIIGYINTRNV